MKGIVIENSLKDRNVLNDIKIVRSWTEGSWKLHEVNVSEDQANKFTNYLDIGPWYIHFWEKGKDKILVVYKDKVFAISSSDKTTWNPAVDYGKLLGIPTEQLDFPID